MKSARQAVRIEDLRVPTSGHFFLLPKAPRQAAVKSLFRFIASESGQGRPLANIVRKQRTHGGVTYVCSLLCFKQPPHPPSFLPGSTLQEVSYGFALLIEVAGLLAVFKKGAANAEEWFEKQCDPVDGRALTRVYGDKAAYEKMSLRRMTISPSELRACSYEAEDLSTTIPVLGLGRSIPRFIRLVHPTEGTVSVTPGTSRLNKSGPKKDVDELALEIANLAPQLKQANASTFLDAFPIPIDVAALTARPTGIVFDTSELVAGVTREGCQVILKKSGRPDADVTDAVIDDFRTARPLRHRAGNWIFRGNPFCEGYVSKTKRSFVVRLSAIRNLTLLRPDGTEEEFAKWIKSHGKFSISFEKPEFFFTQGSLYQSADFARKIDTVAGAIEHNQGLVTVQNEKGRWNKQTRNYHYTAGSTRFENDSIFRFVEDTLCAAEEHLICADLGDEWADFIAISQGRLSLLHCKHGDVAGGASPFQEVIGQAIKNLGRVQISGAALAAKITELERQGNWKPTSAIPRYHGPGGMGAAAEAVIADFQSAREVVLVVTALSKARFDQERQKAPLEPHFIQLVWIVAGFIHTCREKGARARIVCRP